METGVRGEYTAIYNFIIRDILILNDLKLKYCARIYREGFWCSLCLLLIHILSMLLNKLYVL
jgi:hypothetical protein